MFLIGTKILKKTNLFRGSNIVGWWIQMAFVFAYIALVVIDLIVVRRVIYFVQAK